MSETCSPLRRVLRWTPPALLALVVGVGWGLLLWGGGMVSVGTWAFMQLVHPFAALVGLLMLLVHGIRKRRFSAPMVATLVLSLVAIVPFGWGFGIARIPFPASLESAAPRADVRLPLDEPALVVWGGDDLEHNYHVFTPDQRWAYDLVVQPALHGGKELTGYGCYGRPLLAPAPGKVIAAHDGEPDRTPGELDLDLETPMGNWIGLKLETGTYVLMAHMKPGSLKVKVGDTVAEGQQLGECGNSGNTSEPHVHMHHQRQDPNDFPVGFAEGLPLYFRDVAGREGAIMPQGGVEVGDDDSIQPLGETVQHGG